MALARATAALERRAATRRHLDAAAEDLADRPAFSSYAIEACAGLPELALDLIVAGDDDRRELGVIMRRGLDVLRDFARAVPIAAPAMT